MFYSRYRFNFNQLNSVVVAFTTLCYDSNMDALNAKKISPADQLRAASKAFWNIVEHYKFSREEQALLLGVNYNRDRLNQLQKERKIPESDDSVLRVSILVGIHKNLRLLFPYNRDLVYKWMKVKNDDFGGVSPIEYIKHAQLGEGLNRIAAIRRRLDFIRCNGF